MLLKYDLLTPLRLNLSGLCASAVNPESSLRALCASVVNPASEPAPAQLGAWLLSATAALSIAALLKQFARKTPLEAEFLSRKEFTAFKDQDFAELRRHVDRSFQALSEKLDAINDRLFDLHSVIARVDERTTSASAWSPEIKHRRPNLKTANPEPKVPTL